MEHKIKVTENMSPRQRRNVYQDLKNVLSDISTPMSSIGEVGQNWKVQEELKKLIEITGK